MVQRCVYVRLVDDLSNPAGRAEVVAHTREVFATLPGIRAFRVGVPADDHAEAAWDLLIQVEFDTIDQVAAYAVEATHKRYVEEYLNPRAAVKKAWNFHVA